jgi:hypothetical protein
MAGRASVYVFVYELARPSSDSKFEQEVHMTAILIH